MPLTSMGHIRMAMDRVLMAHGAYVPVELLLDLGCLHWADYQSWRRGERPDLAGALAGAIPETMQLLRDAAAWAGSLGLAAERQVYFGWGRCADRQLVFCERPCAEADSMLATHYVPRTESTQGGQLDIFLHSATTTALEGLRVALRAADPVAAETCLADLASQAPEHRLLDAARRLTSALSDLAEPLPADAAEAELERLEGILSPAARSLLGPDARSLLALFWRRLAQALAGTPFDSQRPLLHASHAWLRCHDWWSAASAVLETAAYASEPVLLARLAEARRRNGDRNRAIETWCELCWRFPDAADAVLDDAGIPDSRVHQAWLHFRDLDPPAETVLFPARLLLSEPGLARALSLTIAAGDSAGEQAFRAVRTLLHEDGIDARKAVQSAAPWLLEFYLTPADGLFRK